MQIASGTVSVPYRYDLTATVPCRFGPPFHSERAGPVLSAAMPWNVAAGSGAGTHMTKKTYDKPSEVGAKEGRVLVNGPDGWTLP